MPALDHHRHGPRPALAFMLASALALAASATVAQPPPPISKGCHPVPPKADAAADADAGEASGFDTADLTGKPLAPGGARKTLGTNDTESPELQTLKKLLDQRTRFTLQTDQGPVDGELHQVVTRGTDRFCKCHLQVSIAETSPGCVARARVGNFDLGSEQLVADFRDDMNGVVPPKLATRTADGLNIDFVFDARKLLCAGMTSRWMVLNTGWEEEIGPAGVFQAIGPQGEEGPPVPAFAPVH